MKTYIILTVLLLGVSTANAQGKLADTTRFFRLAQQMLLTKHLAQVDAHIYKEFNSNKAYQLRELTSLYADYAIRKTPSCPGADSALASIAFIKKEDDAVERSMVRQVVYYFNNKAAGEQIFNRWTALIRSYATSEKKMSHISFYSNNRSAHVIGIAYHPSGKGGKLPYLLTIVHSL